MGIVDSMSGVVDSMSGVVDSMSGVEGSLEKIGVGGGNGDELECVEDHQ